MLSLFSIAAAQAKKAAEAKNAAAPAEHPSPSGSRQAAMESAAQKQREATLAAMQSSIDKQRASIAVAKDATKGTLVADPSPINAGASFFQLPPPAPLPGNVSVSVSLPAAEPLMPDVNCEPIPVADVTPVLEQAARREDLDPRLLTAVIQQESGFRPCAISRKGAQGLMQLMPATIEQFGVTEPFEVKQNIDAGAKFLKELIGRYSGNLTLALGAYNAGPGTVDAADGLPHNPETMTYVTEILSKLGIQPTPLNKDKP
jgi:soluble lytic murein transglycosylase-like protein